MGVEEKSRKRKKRSITEEGIATVLGRYSTNTVLKLLQEIAKNADEEIDWNALVKETKTGISNAREYQMLWRHLAYGHDLTDELDDAANPLDDESDLEDEVEAFPVVPRATAEAAACVKVLMASDDPIDADVPNNLSIEAPLTINVPMFKAPSESSLLADATMTSTNIIIPVSVPKDPSDEKRRKSGADVSRGKRNVWTAKDDLKLTAAVQKHGEHNWADVAGEDFENDRTPEELSLRWANITKKKSNSIAGTSAELSEARKAKKKSNLKVGTSAELTEARRAATRAIALALEPKGPNFTAARQMSYGTKTTQHDSRIASASLSNPQLGMTGPPKSQVQTKRPPLHCTTSPNSMIKAAAVAAGARIASPADASSAIEAASRSQNVFHIRTGASSLPKSSITSMSNQPCSNFNHNGPLNASVSAYSSTVPNLQLSVAKEAQGNSMKPTEQAVQPNSVGTAIATASIPNRAAKTAEVARVCTSPSEMKELVQSDHVAGLDNKATGELISRSVNQTQDNKVVLLPCSEGKDNGEKHGDITTTCKEIHDNADATTRVEAND